jgi:hypothetical protein
MTTEIRGGLFTAFVAKTPGRAVPVGTRPGSFEQMNVEAVTSR